MSLEFRHEPEHQKFIAIAKGERCVIDYKKPKADVLDLTSTRVPDSIEGKGIGTQFVKRALEWARENDFSVIPTCPFVEHVIEENPEYADLRKKS